MWEKGCTTYKDTFELHCLRVDYYAKSWIVSQIDKIPPKTIDFRKWDTVIYKQCVALYNPKMYPHTKYGIPTANNMGDVPEVKFKVTPTSTGHSGTLTCIHNLNLGFLP